MNTGDKLAMFAVAVGLTTALALFVAAIVADRREWAAEDARTEKTHAAVLADTRRWQDTSAAAQPRSTARRPLLPGLGAWAAKVASSLRPAPTPDPAPTLDAAETASTGWPVVNTAYSSGNPALADPSPVVGWSTTGRAQVISRPTYDDIDKMARDLRAHADDPDRTMWMPLVESRKATR
ncbi:hypothetical protein AB0L22_08625 [Micromonospora haikouensis]|uniref:hypothetical protein n=1 Tax=Micromonospora haikouensis TaxID=686309 RepID=UPI0034431904